MATGTIQDEKLVGIVPLEPDWSQPGIERLGPPPGNAEILIRGGAGWVFGIPAREETPHPNIERLEKAPSRDDVALALAREMAWRWYYGRPPFVWRPSLKEPGVSKPARDFHRYAPLEGRFIEQARSLIPGMFHPDLGTAAMPDAGSDFEKVCSCLPGQPCCSDNRRCLTCQEN